MRISKVTTRNGDNGETCLGSGKKIAKYHPIIDVLGDIDALNCYIGFLLTSNTLYVEDEPFNVWIQDRLFDISAEVASIGENTTGPKIISEEHIIELENQIEDINKKLPPLKEFVRPGGADNKLEGNARAHLCRVWARKAERTCWNLRLRPYPLVGVLVKSNSLIFLNRLSDYYFVLARKLAAGSETLWIPTKKV